MKIHGRHRSDNHWVDMANRAKRGQRTRASANHDRRAMVLGRPMADAEVGRRR
jgi:hypothetical protein